MKMTDEATLKMEIYEALQKIDNVETCQAFLDVDDELERATDLYGPFKSPHEGWAILKEEVDELWDAVKMKNDGSMDEERNLLLRKEASQVAAMALRFMVDCTYPEPKEDRT